MSSLSTSLYFDIGSNLLDTKYNGEYFGKTRHPPDLSSVLSRTFAPSGPCGVVICTAGTVDEAGKTLDLAKGYDSMYSTCGVHPTRSEGEEGELEGMYELVMGNNRVINPGGKIVAVGELGLDYDRLEFSNKEVRGNEGWSETTSEGRQQKHCIIFLQNEQPSTRRFAPRLTLIPNSFCDSLRPSQSQLSKLNEQLDMNERFIAGKVDLPLFLHSRSCGEDLYDILSSRRASWSTGVVHSFDGTKELADKYLSLGLMIGVNGCSFRTPENLATIEGIPMDRLLIETDSPYCDIRSTHAGYKYVSTEFDCVKDKKWVEGCMVKGRNEPCRIVQVAECLAGVKGVEVEDVKKMTRENGRRLFLGDV